jgi:hypothetical protein
MRKKSESNREIRDAFLNASVDLENFTNKAKLERINRAMFQNASKDDVVKIGVRALQKTYDKLTKNVQRVLLEDSNKPISNSIQKENEDVERRRRENSEGLEAENRPCTPIIDLTCNLRWKWGFNLKEPEQTTTIGGIQTLLQKQKNAQTKHNIDILKNENTIKAGGSIGMLGEGWLLKQKLPQNEHIRQQILEYRKRTKKEV